MPSSAATQGDDPQLLQSGNDASSGEEETHGSSNETNKKRKRSNHEKTSCELCKARKVKCDRAEPACSWCARHNRTCVYVERQKPGSRIGLGVELEAKVSTLQEQVWSLERRVDDHIAQSKGQPDAYSSSLSLRDAIPQDSYARLNGHDSWPAAGAPSHRSVASIPPSWHDQSPHVEPPDGPPRPRELSSHPSYTKSHQETTPSTHHLGGTRHAVLYDDQDLPPHDMLYTLVDLFFKHCNTWCPILDRKHTFEIFFETPSPLESDQTLLKAIVATTLRFYTDDRLDYETRLKYHASCKRAVQTYAMEHIDVQAVRSLAILALDELGSSNGPKTWNMLAMLVQNIRQLNLSSESGVCLANHLENTPLSARVQRVTCPLPVSWIEDEGRRRLCWMVYLLDRYTTIVTTSLDFLFEESQMNRVLPCSYDLFSGNVPVESRTLDPSSTIDAPRYLVNKPENLGSFSYHCEILGIMSKVYNFIKSPIDIASTADMASWRSNYQHLDRALDGWLQNLPSEYSRLSALCHSDPGSRVANWFVLHSAYVVAVVRLHSTTAYPVVRSDLFVPSHYAMQRCLSAVQSLNGLVQVVHEANGLHLLGPIFALSLWVAARLLIVHAATVGGAVDPAMASFIETLEYIGQHWGIAERYARTLSRVLKRERDGEMSFSAMRKSAYDLVVLTSTTRISGLEHTSTQVVTPSEVDSIEIFDFFNYPAQARGLPGGRQVSCCVGH